MGGGGEGVLRFQKPHFFFNKITNRNNNTLVPLSSEEEEEDLHLLARVRVWVLVLVDIQTSVLSCLDQSNEAVHLRGSLGVVCSKKR